MFVKKASACIFILTVSILAGVAWAQKLSTLDRDRAIDMLRVIGDDVRKHYYDTKFHGLNWDATLEEARRNISRLA